MSLQLLGRIVDEDTPMLIVVTFDEKPWSSHVFGYSLKTWRSNANLNLPLTTVHQTIRVFGLAVITTDLHVCVCGLKSQLRRLNRYYIWLLINSVRDSSVWRCRRVPINFQRTTVMSWFSISLSLSLSVYMFVCLATVGVISMLKGSGPARAQ